MRLAARPEDRYCTRRVAHSMHMTMFAETGLPHREQTAEQPLGHRPSEPMVAPHTRHAVADLTAPSASSSSSEKRYPQ